MMLRSMAGLASIALMAAQPLAAQVAREAWFPGNSSIHEPKIIPPGFRGSWAPNEAACRDEDGVDRILIEPEGLDTYESGGRVERVTQAGQDRSIRLKIAYEGEGEFRDEVETWTLDEAGNRLSIADLNEGNGVNLIRCR